MDKETDRDKAMEPARSFLYRWGYASWLVIGIALLIALFGFVLDKAYQLIWPLVLAVMLGIVLMPISMFMHRKAHLPRWLAAGLTMVVVLLVIFAIVAVIIYGIASQSDELAAQAENGVTKIKSWLGGLEITDKTIDAIESGLKKIWPDLASGIASGVTGGIAGFLSLMVGAILGLFILFFFLNDDGTISEWSIKKMPVPEKEARLVYEDVTASVQGYFKGTTIVAASNAIVVLPVLLAFRMPLIGVISFIIFVTGYIPSIGGYIGGAFAVFIALASKGLTAGIVMLVVLILANTLLQQPVQAWAYHKTLELHPLVALLVTVAGGIFAGIAGAVLAVPVTAVVLKVKSDLDAARASGALTAEPEPEPEALVSGAG